MSKFPQTLDTSILSDDARKLEERLLSRVIGQDRAVKSFVRVFQQIEAGLGKASRPAGVFLFMGPTGTGKTELVRAAAEHLLGKKDAITRIDCGEFAHSHETAKLIGSPPGYIGFNDRDTVRLSQSKIDKFQTPQCKINFILFDEIEEAHDAVFSAILQIMDAGRLTLGNGDEVDFSRSIIIMTSNLGEKETQSVLMGKGIGLAPPTHGERVVMDDKVYEVSKSSATKHFKAKFMNRIDRIIVFRSLGDESLRQILHIELDDLELRLMGTAYKKWIEGGKEGSVLQFNVRFKTTKAADDFLLKEGTSPIYGARELNRAIERFVSFPLGSLIGSRQIEHGDVLEIDHVSEEKQLVFRKTGHRDLTTLVPALKYNATPPDELKKELEPTNSLEKALVDFTEAMKIEACKHGFPKKNCTKCNPPPTPPPVNPGWFRTPFKGGY